MLPWIKYIPSTHGRFLSQVFLHILRGELANVWKARKQSPTPVSRPLPWRYGWQWQCLLCGLSRRSKPLRTSWVSLQMNRKSWCWRFFYVMMEDGLTSPHFMQRGVPQVAALSPTLLNLAMVRPARSPGKSLRLHLWTWHFPLSCGVNRLQRRPQLRRGDQCHRTLPERLGQSIWNEMCTLVAFTC